MGFVCWGNKRLSWKGTLTVPWHVVSLLWFCQTVKYPILNRLLLLFFFRVMRSLCFTEHWNKIVTCNFKPEIQLWYTLSWKKLYFIYLFWYLYIYIFIYIKVEIFFKILLLNKYISFIKRHHKFNFILLNIIYIFNKLINIKYDNNNIYFYNIKKY